MPKFAAMLIGFAFLFPVRLVDGVNVRLPDVVAILLALLGMVAFVTSEPNRQRISWGYLAIGVFTVGWIGVDLTYSAYLPVNTATSMILVRWIVALPAAYQVALLTRNATFRKFLVLGMVAGCLATNALTVSDLITFRMTGRPQFLLHDNPGLVNGDYRACGILEASNGAAIAGLFLVPLLIGVAEEFGFCKAALVVIIPAICVVFYVTQSRGAVLVSVGLLLLWGLMRRPASIFAMLAGTAVLGVLLLLAGPSLDASGSARDGLLAVATSRFTNETAIEGNASDRTDTIAASLALAVEYPLGMGSTYVAPLDQATGFNATHNALTQLALMGGIPLAIIVTCLLVDSARHVRRAPHVNNWVALYILLVSMFESAFFNPFFSLMVLWVIAQTGLSSPSSTEAHAARSAPSDPGEGLLFRDASP